MIIRRILLAKRPWATTVAFLLASLPPGSAAAQTGFALRAGSLGAGVEVAHQFRGPLAIRAGGSYFPLNREITFENETIDLDVSVEARFASAQLFADFMPFGHWFRLTGGLMYNGVNARASLEALEDYTIKSRTFTKAQVGTLAVDLSHDRTIAPYAGVGIGNVASGSRRIGLTLDAGILFSGPVQVRNVRGTGMIEPMTEATATVQEALNEIRIYPVISIGLAIRS